MPRKFHRVLNKKSPDDLRAIIEELIFLSEEKGGIHTFDKTTQKMLRNVISYHRKLDEIAEEDINLIWETASHLLKKIGGKKPADLIEEKKKEDRPPYLMGCYWIFPKGSRFIVCDDHREYAKKNPELFIEGLGIDAWSFTRESLSGQPTLLPLIFAAGGIRAEFYKEGNKKTARFQLAQCSLPWLKNKVVKMPILHSYFNVLDPHKPYTGKWSQGISFVFKRPKEIRAPKR